MGKLKVFVSLVVMFAVSHQDPDQGPNSPSELRPKTVHGRRVPSDPDENLTSALPALDISNEMGLDYITGPVSTTVIPAAYMLALLVGVPSNAFILACLSGKRGSLYSATLYLSLAASDLLLLLSLTLRIHYHLHGNHWVFGELACKLVTACFYGNIYCSAHAHMCIGLLRYLAVVHPFFYRGLSKRSGTLWASLTVWAFCAVAMVPEFLVRHSYHIAGVGVYTCHDVLPYQEEEYRFLIPYRLTLICLGFVVPLVVITFAYGSVVHQLNRSSCDWGQYVKASTLVFTIFILCYAPSNVLHFVHYMQLYTRYQDDLYVYYSVAVCLCCFHSCLDPFLSYLMAKNTTASVQFSSFRSRPLRASSLL